MICSKCGHNNRNTAKFCEECGNKFEKICPECGHKNSPQAKFCDECGKKLETLKVEKPKKPLSKEKIQKIPQFDLSSFIPRHIEDKIRSSGIIEGERKSVTVLFADVAGFTSLSEKLDPEEVSEIMNDCFKLLTGEIHRYEGTINKFLGDGLMALFGAPITHEDHPHRALLAALTIQKRLLVFEKEMMEKRGNPFKMRIGINTGQVVVGGMGSDMRMEYTAMGDTINLASRIEGLTEPGTVAVSENTYRTVKKHFEWEYLGEKSVKGIKKPVKVYRALKPHKRKSRIDVAEEKELTEFIGRDKELELITNTLNNVKKGNGQVLVIIGEAGVGKSRLLYEFKRRSIVEDLGYLEGFCISYGNTVPFLPVVDMVKGYFGIEDIDSDQEIRKKLREGIKEPGGLPGSIIPYIENFLSLKVEDKEFVNLDAETKRRRTFDMLKGLVIRGSKDRPLILCIEDLQWMDKSSEDVCNELVELCPNNKLLFLYTTRPEYKIPWINKSYYNQITLNPLTKEKSSEMITSMLQIEELPQVIRALILKKAEGNPFYDNL